MAKGKLEARPGTLGELRHSRWSEERIASRSVRDEMRDNLLAKLERKEPLFPGVIGYEDTVVPQLVNAILSRHHMVLLGLRGQTKSRILRSLVDLLDDEIPMVASCEINDNPYAPLCRACRDRLAELGDRTPIAWLPREMRYVEKLATPDVTIADIIGDVDPIRAARRLGADRGSVYAGGFQTRYANRVEPRAEGATSVRPETSDIRREGKDIRNAECGIRNAE